MRTTIRNNWGKSGRPVVAGLATSLLSVGMTPTATGGELVFGDLKSGLGNGIEWQHDDTLLNVKGALSLGTIRRMDNPSQRLTSSEYGMNLFNDGDLNYKRGDAVSTSVETYLQADLSHRNIGLLVSAKGWYDYAQKHQGVEHGSVPNGYRPGKPLSDSGFDSLARFSNAVIDDAYVYGNFQPAGQDLLVRLGDQAIPWVTPTTIGGGLQAVNAFDWAAARRASSITEARTVAMPALYAKLALSENLSIDGFNQFELRPSTYPGCGTFLSTSDYAQPGCDQFLLNGSVLSSIAGRPVYTSDGQALNNPLDYVPRGPDHRPGNNQYGASMQYLWQDVGLLGLYFANYTSRDALTQVVRTGPGVLTPPAANQGQAKPAGVAAYYQRAFPTRVRLYALNFKTRLPDGTGIYAEYSYRPNQPIAWNGADFISGLLAGSGPLGYLAKTPTGYLARGYDRFRVSQINLGASHPFGQVLGGEMKLSAEAGLKYVHDLPDTNDRRYGRAGFGNAPYGSSSKCTGPAQKCAMDGFVTPFSWGTRLKVENQYRNVLPGLDLTPSLAFLYDVKGHAHDGVFSEGRHAQVLAVHGTFKSDYTFNVAYLNTGGGDYNIVADRSMLEASVGLHF